MKSKKKIKYLLSVIRFIEHSYKIRMASTVLEIITP